MNKTEKDVPEIKRAHIISLVAKFLPDYNVLDMKRHVYKYPGKKDTYVTLVYVKCPNPDHPAYWVDLRHIKNGGHCNYCVRDNLRHKTDTKYQLIDLQNILNECLGNDYQALDFMRKTDGSKYGKKWYIYLKCPNPAHLPYWTTLNVIKNGCGCRKCVEEAEFLTERKRSIVLEACRNNNCKFLGVVPSNKKRFQAIVLKIEDCFGYWYNVTLDHLRNRRMRYTLKFEKNPYVLHNIHLWCKINRPEYEFCEQEFNGMTNKYLFKYIGDEIEIAEKDRYFIMSFSNFMYDFGIHPLLKKYRKSYGAFLVRNFLKGQQIDFIEEQTFVDLLSKKGAHLFFDFYLPKLNTVIEVDGIQHFQPVECFGGEESFKSLSENDEIKDKYCQIKKIKILRIPYYLYGSKREPCTEYLSIMKKWFNNRE